MQALAAVDYVVTACPTCAVGLKQDSVDLLRGTEFETEAALLASRVRDFTQFIIDDLKGLDLLAAASQKTASTRVTYHDPCHLKRGMGISDQPRTALRVAGLEVVEMQESDVCCGFAGSYSFSFPDIAESILRRKVNNIRSVDAGVVATDCPGCILQIRGGVEKHKCPVAVKHTAQLLAERLPK